MQVASHTTILSVSIYKVASHKTILSVSIHPPQQDAIVFCRNPLTILLSDFTVTY